MTLLPLCIAALMSSLAVYPADRQIPRYDRIFLIIEENHSYDVILADGKAAPNLVKLANTYGSATRFYAERHPSEPNYVAIPRDQPTASRTTTALPSTRSMLRTLRRNWPRVA